MKKKYLAAIMAGLVAMSSVSATAVFAAENDAATESADAVETENADTAEMEEKAKVRTIITTDGEIDDQFSLIRYLLYANEFELDGIVSSSSIFHFTDQGEGMFKGKDSNQKILDEYAKVYENLSQHAEGYPTPEYLTEHNYEGNVTTPGEMDTDTEGSLFIKDCIMDDREDRLLIQAWGGCNTIAAALRSIEEEYKDTDQWEDIYKKICNKVVVINDLDQDDTISNYFLENWSNLPVLLTYIQYSAMGYPEGRVAHIGEDMEAYYSADWMQSHLEGKGALAQAYLDRLEETNERSQGAFLSEGDTPCYMYALDVGLRSFEDPTYGGWGGRYEKVMYNFGSGYNSDGSPWSGQTKLWGLWMATDDNGDYFKPLAHWIQDFQEDFAARMDWCVSSYEEANHAPVVTIKEGLDLTAKRGDTITLTAETSDPDGDEVNVNFWQYDAADTYGGPVDLTTDGNQVTFTVPEDAKPGATIHVIAEAQDNDETNPITRYQRVIVTVAGEDAEE